MTTYEQMGMAALLPGMQFAIECMQRQLDEMRAQLAQMQNGRQPAKKSRSMKQNPSKVGNIGWPADPAARSAEMKRRMAVARAKAPKIKGPGSPAFAKRASNAAKARWARDRTREGRTAKINAARLANRKARVKLAVAS
jgi:hypothetical protein